MPTKNRKYYEALFRSYSDLVTLGQFQKMNSIYFTIVVLLFRLYIKDRNYKQQINILSITHNNLKVNASIIPIYNSYVTGYNFFVNMNSISQHPHGNKSERCFSNV